MAGNGKHSPIPATTEHHSYSQHHGSDTETGQDNINVTRNKSDGQQHAGYRKAGQDQINLSPQADDQRQYFTDSNCAARQNETPKKLKEGPVGWGDLPQRRQLFILAIARLSEPLVQTSLQSYMFFQLQSFDKTLPDSTIATQAGMLQGSFTAAQFVTAMMWGRVSDSTWGGRKLVLMVGLVGTMLSCIGFGLAQTFWQAMVFRTLGGMLNGNVGVMRTMIAEIIEEKKYQSRAFLILPMCFNIGVIVGPVLGGLLADPAGSYPDLFGDIWILKKFPYAPPNILSAVFLLIGAVCVFLGLEETLGSIRHKEDFGSKCGRKLADLFRKCHGKRPTESHAYVTVGGDEQSERLLNGDARWEEEIEMSPISTSTNLSKKKKAIPRYKHTLPFRRILTPNVLFTFLAHGILAFHLGTFNNIWFVFLSTAVADPKHPNPAGYHQKLPFLFTGGLGMSASHIGFALACLGLIGISLQLFVYPVINYRLGVVKSWRIFLFCFPFTYLIVPYLAIVPSKTPPPAEKDGVLLWVALCLVLFIQVLGRTFALPATIILLNNCSPHPSVLGTIHGMGQSVSSAARTIGPIAGGWLYGLGLNHGIVGAVWWGLSGVAVVGCVASYFVREGTGHEIILDGDAEAEHEWQMDAASRRPSTAAPR